MPIGIETAPRRRYASWTPPITAFFLTVGRFDGGEAFTRQMCRSARLSASLLGRRRAAQRPFWPASALRSSIAEPDEAAHVVREIREADLEPRPSQADRSDEQAHHPLLMREHMLDGAAHFRLLRIGEARALRHRSALGFLAMNARDEPAPQKHLFVFRRAIGRVRKDLARRVGSIEDFLQPRHARRRASPSNCGSAHEPGRSRRDFCSQRPEWPNRLAAPRPRSAWPWYI